MISKNVIIEELLKFSPEIISFGERINDDRIEQFEKKFSLILPIEYKNLISVFNSIELFGETIYGLSNAQNEVNLETVYLREHTQVMIPQPAYLVPFSDDGGGSFYCFDTRGLEPDQTLCPIVFWESNVTYAESDPEVVNNSFYEWVMEVFIGWTLESVNYDGSFKT